MFLLHQLSPPCFQVPPQAHWSQVSEEVKGGATSTLPPQDQYPGSVSKVNWWWHPQGNQWLERSEGYSEMDCSVQAYIKVIPSASALITRAPEKSSRNRKKQENIKHSGNVTFDETVNIAPQIQHHSLAREHSAAIIEILGTSQYVGCKMDEHQPCWHYR